jgi:hypothetical protein
LAPEKNKGEGKKPQFPARATKPHTENKKEKIPPPNLPHPQNFLFRNTIFLFIKQK